MARKRPSAWLGTLIFVIVVAQIGIAIEASGHMRNPFQVFAELRTIQLDFTNGGMYSQESQPRIQPSVPGVTVPQGGLGDVRWSEFRSVLFDWWFIAAITALVIMIGRPIGMLLKRLRMALKRSSPIDTFPSG